MSALMVWLGELNARDTRVRAVLRRSLAFEPGTYVPAFPYIEPFVGASASSWRRSVHYLVAGLWASHWREARGPALLSLGRAAATHQLASGSANTERRFINLLDADEDQLSDRLRQMVALLKDQPIDFEAMLAGLLYWNDDQRRVQIRWAKEFYGMGTGTSRESATSTDGAVT